MVKISTQKRRELDERLKKDYKKIKKNKAKGINETKGEDSEVNAGIIEVSTCEEVPTGNRKRTQTEIAEDLEIEYKLYLQGYAYRAIAIKLNENRPAYKHVSYMQVYQDIQRFIKQYTSQMFKDTAELTSIELNRINQVETEAWQAWERSKKDIIRHKTRDLTGKNASKEITEETITNAGNKDFLELVKWAVEMRCKIFGIKAPERSINTQINLNITSKPH